ncbi:Alkaline phosphatase D precursor [compost metagenome]
MKYISILLLVVLAACSQKPTTAPTSSADTQIFGEIYHSPLRSRGLDYDATLEKIAFGSCANQDLPQPLWKTISAAQPDLFLFMGDNIYTSHPGQQPMTAQYRKLDQIPEYIAIRETVPFLVTWDDHDFGQKDGGADFSGKDQSRKAFLNYWPYVKNSIPLEQGGVYHSKMVGPKKKVVQVILLDTRYFRTPLHEVIDHEGTYQGYSPSDAPTDTVLGNAQWEWFEAQLKRPADVRFIVSSIQLIANEHKFEKWDNFPRERQRFFDLLKKTKAKNVIVLSGDRHMSMIAKQDIPGYGPLYDITASSINRPNKYMTSDSKYLGPVYAKESFGMANIDWKKKVVRVDIHDMDNKVVNSVNIKLK